LLLADDHLNLRGFERVPAKALDRFLRPRAFLAFSAGGDGGRRLPKPLIDLRLELLVLFPAGFAWEVHYDVDMR
jgi:hypothetical protein